MIRIAQLKLPLDYEKTPLAAHAARALRCSPDDISAVRLRKRSVDARDKGDIRFVLTLDVETKRPLRSLPRGCEQLSVPAPRPLPAPRALAHRPLVVGLGPAGLFAARAGGAARARKAVRSPGAASAAGAVSPHRG